MMIHLFVSTKQHIEQPRLICVYQRKEAAHWLNIKIKYILAKDEPPFL